MASRLGNKVVNWLTDWLSAWQTNQLTKWPTSWVADWLTSSFMVNCLHRCQIRMTESGQWRSSETPGRTSWLPLMLPPKVLTSLQFSTSSTMTCRKTLRTMVSATGWFGLWMTEVVGVSSLFCSGVVWLGVFGCVCLVLLKDEHCTYKTCF